MGAIIKDEIKEFKAVSEGFAVLHKNIQQVLHETINNKKIKDILKLKDKKTDEYRY